MLMKILPKLLLLGILVTISLPSTAQQLIRLQETANQKAPQPVTADIGGLFPGIYIATLVVDGNIVNSIRIIVSK